MHNAAYIEEEQPSFKQHLTPGSRHRKISEGRPPEEGGDALSVASGSDVASEYIFVVMAANADSDDGFQKNA